MLHPSYSELMEKINANSEEPVIQSRYSIVMGAAKRARQMVDNGYMEQADHSRRPLSLAVEELDNGKVRILSAAEAEEMAAQKAAEEAAAAAEKEAEEAAKRAEIDARMAEEAAQQAEEETEASSELDA